ncbi:MAG TPA: platelet-activating factor acetylhydrolase IB subunit [Phycisphaerae bacterium]|jgi:beta-glucosidase
MRSVKSNLLFVLTAASAATALRAQTTQPADKPAKAESASAPVSRTGEKWWQERMDAVNARAKQGDADLIFIGDSITQGWENAGKDVWAKNYGTRKAVNLGFSGDRTQHVLWRLEHGNIDGISPKLAVIMIGTNNTGGVANTSDEITAGIGAIVTSLRTKLPQTKILLLGIFPRGEKPDHSARSVIATVNRSINKLADDRSVYYLDIGQRFLADDGSISKDIMPDFLHLSPRGYEIWAAAIEEKVAALMKAS